MRTRVWVVLFVGLLGLALMVAPAWAQRDLGRETLDPLDGWAAFSTGTTGGAAADSAHVFYVGNRQQFVAALKNRDTTPKIIYVSGMIDANVDDNNQPLACADYNRNGYTLEGYLAAYDPAVWGRGTVPSGTLETARVASQAAQQARVRLRIGSNTTIVGTSKEAGFRGAWLDIRDANNIIIRNLNLLDTYDCFPQWDPTDGSAGNWNALYDSISLRNTTHVWVDHVRFEDRDTADSTLPRYFGRLFQVHDGQFDITNGSDLVTASWNRFLNHEKVILIGSSDSMTSDRGKLNVTIHHNLFGDISQRGPRVRFGKVHMYNNYYKLDATPEYQYAWGVGKESAIYAENNFFRSDKSMTPDMFIRAFGGTALYETGTLVNGKSGWDLLDVLALYNAVKDPDLATDVAWTPTLFLPVQPTLNVQGAVQGHSGPFDWIEQ